MENEENEETEEEEEWIVTQNWVIQIYKTGNENEKTPDATTIVYRLIRAFSTILYYKYT